MSRNFDLPPFSVSSLALHLDRFPGGRSVCPLELDGACKWFQQVEGFGIMLCGPPPRGCGAYGVRSNPNGLSEVFCMALQ